MDGRTPPDVAFLPARSEMGGRIAAHDWANTPLGPIESWPAALKIAVGMMVSSSFPKCLCWGEDLIMLYNDAFIPILRAKHPCVGQKFLDVWSEVSDAIAPIAAKALAGEPTFIEDFPLTINRSGMDEDATFTFCYSPVRDEHGVVRGMLDTVVETTGKVKAEALATLRNRELVHRSRNAYALVSSMINQTFRNATSLTETKEKLQQRIRALVSAQDVLMEAHASTPSMLSAARLVLDPFIVGSGQIKLDGADVPIGREQATALSLALHELATNATKYGALSSDGGRVTLSWTLDSSDEMPFRLTWVERDGPQTGLPSREGFGTRIISGVLPEAFHGSVKLDYASDGFSLFLRGHVT